MLSKQMHESIANIIVHDAMIIVSFYLCLVLDGAPADGQHAPQGNVHRINSGVAAASAAVLRGQRGLRVGACR